MPLIGNIWMKTIVANRIRTPDGTILQSYNRHDYKTYKDKNGHEYMVDGGNDYLRRNVVEEAPHEELSVYSDDPFEVIREAFSWGTRGKDGQQPLKYVALCNLETDHIQAILDTQTHISETTRDILNKELEYRKV